MQSLRKTFLMVCGLTVLLAQLGAQAPQPRTTPAAPGQNRPALAQENRPGRITFSVNQVVVPVTVKDGSGRLAADLRRDEFRIFEDAVEQKVVYVGAEPVPISMVMLIDNDLKSKDAKQVSESLWSVVAGLALTDEALVCRFDQFFHVGKGFISDQDKLLTELKRTRLDDEPSTGPSSPAISNGPSINGHSPTGDAPNMTGPTLNIKGQPTKALDDAMYAAAQVLKDRGLTSVIQCLGRLGCDIEGRAGHIRGISRGGVPVNRRAIADRRARRPRGRLVVQMRPLQLGEEFVLVADEALPEVEKLVKSTDEG